MIAPLLLMLLATGGMPTTIGVPAKTRPREIQQAGLDQKLGQHIPLDIQLRDEHGNAVRIGDYFHPGKPVVLTMVYFECPMLCTYELNGLTKAMRTLRFNAGNEYEVLSVSFNPHDGPQLAADKKAAYLKSYGRAGASQGWHFLTGEQTQIKRLADAVGFRYQWDPVSKTFAHPAAVMVLTPTGEISRYLFGIEYGGRDLHLSLLDASARKIANPVETAVLYCFHYDPSKGKYSLVIMNVVRIAGAITVVVMAALLWIGFRGGRLATKGAH